MTDAAWQRKSFELDAVGAQEAEVATLLGAGDVVDVAGVLLVPGDHAQRGGISEGKVDEAFGVFRVIAAHREAGEVCAIKREGRDALRDGERALPELQANRAGDALLRDVEETVKRGAHTAQADIYESIDELKYYRQHFLQ